MSMLEFYEALARIAEEANFPPGPGLFEVCLYEKKYYIYIYTVILLI